jgi:hypothetical protein
MFLVGGDFSHQRQTGVEAQMSDGDEGCVFDEWTKIQLTKDIVSADRRPLTVQFRPTGRISQDSFLHMTNPVYPSRPVKSSFPENPCRLAGFFSRLASVVVVTARIVAIWNDLRTNGIRPPKAACA